MKLSSNTSLTMALLATSLSAAANPTFQADSILVASEHVIMEYSGNGQLLSTIDIPIISSIENSRDLLVLENGQVAVYNGAFTPELAIFDGVNWTAHIIDGWSTPNNISYGGIANVGNQVYLTDGYTSGAEEEGLIAFDLDTETSDRFIDTREYIDITLGADNLLYALRNTYGFLDVFDPQTHELVKTLTLGFSSSSRGITANQAGEIFLVSWSGYVSKFDANGTLIKTLTIGGNLQDIDIDQQGRIVVGSRVGEFHVTDESLTAYDTYSVPTGQVFVAFATPVEYSIEPEPPVLTGSHYRHGRNIYTTLNWSTEAESVDVYYNGDLLETIADQTEATYAFFKKHAQSFVVCNSGTEDCSETYVSN